jgi:hypothetical protein
MKQVLTAVILAAAFTAAIFFQGSVAYAGEASEDLSLCVAALEEQDLAPSGEYRAKFEGRKGGRLTTVTVRLIPAQGEAVTGECKIRKGAVESAQIKA